MRFGILLTLLGVSGIAVTHGHATEAVYQVEFENLWNPTDHPNNFPGPAHFTALVGASHNDRVGFWAPGSLATLGVERVAELGSTMSFLSDDVIPQISAGNVLQAYNNSRDIFLGQSATGPTLTVSTEFPLVSLLSMVAPSPDWFVGVHDFDLSTGGTFPETRVVDFTSFYDAGTEDGSGFSLSNPATVPQRAISEVSGVDAALVFVDPFATRGATLPPIARLTFTRVSLTIPEPTAAALLLITISGVAWRRGRRS